MFRLCRATSIVQRCLSTGNARRRGLGLPKGYGDAPYEVECHTLSGLPEQISSGHTFTVLGIESSCDDTGVAVVRSDGTILANVVYSQYSVHEKFGGVVPSLAMEAHSNVIDDAVSKALKIAGLNSVDDVNAIAVTKGPGLEICLRVGCRKAQELAIKFKKPFVTVHHLEAHCMMARLAGEPVEADTEDEVKESAPQLGIHIPPQQELPHFTPRVPYPFLTLLVSGGHTSLLVCRGLGQYESLGGTLDDSLGEAFDKAARLLGLPLSSSGGAAVEAAAAKSTYAIKAQTIRTKARKILRRISGNNASSVDGVNSAATSDRLEGREKDLVREYRRNNPTIATTTFKMKVPLRDRKQNCDFSYSGLKNSFRIAVGNERQNAGLPIESSNAPTQQMMPVSEDTVISLPPNITTDLCYAFQDIAFAHIEDRVSNALDKFENDTNNSNSNQLSALVVVGGVAANKSIRENLSNLANEMDFKTIYPDLKFCGDNAAMIAWAGIKRFKKNLTDNIDISARSRWPLDKNAPYMKGPGLKL